MINDSLDQSERNDDLPQVQRVLNTRMQQETMRERYRMNITHGLL